MEIYRSYGVFWYRLITRLALDDVFHSGWFFVLIALFAVNLMFCTTRRIRRSSHEIFSSPRYLAFPDGNAVLQLENLCPRESTIRSVRQALRKIGYRRIDVVHSHDSDAQIVGRRRRWGRLAPDFVHLGTLIILIGGLLGFLRQEGSFIVNEWGKGTRFLPCSNAEGSPCVPDSFAFQVDAFGVETYGDTLRVKDYWAEVSIWTDDRLDQRGRISVNRPLTVRGVGFYAWRYGDDVQAALVRLHVMDRERNAVTAELELQIGDTIVVPGTQLWLTALRFYRTFALTDDGQPTDLGNVPGGHGAVLLQITGVDETGTTVAYRDLALPFVPQSDVVLSHMFVLADAFVPAFLKIHYARNPGYPIVWWGFVLVMAGLAGAFYFTPSQIRVAIHPDHILLRVEERSATRRSAKRLEEIAAAIRLHCNEQEG